MFHMVLTESLAGFYALPLFSFIKLNTYVAQLKNILQQPSIRPRETLHNQERLKKKKKKKKKAVKLIALWCQLLRRQQQLLLW